MNLNSTEQDRVLKLAGMLRSGYDGEKLNALSMLEKIAKGKGKEIEDFFRPTVTASFASVDMRPPPPPREWEEKPRQRRPAKMTDYHRDTLAKMAGWRRLSKWEREFINDLQSRDWKPTARQWEIVEKIYAQKYQE
jgi:hypothetical protein